MTKFDRRYFTGLLLILCTLTGIVAYSIGHERGVIDATTTMQDTRPPFVNRFEH